MTDTKLDVRVYPIDEPEADSKTLAFASVTVDDSVAIRGIRVVDSEKGLFVSMPQTRDRYGDYHDTAHPITAALRSEINLGVLDELERVASLAPDQRGYEKPDKEAVSTKKIEDIKLDIRVHPLKYPKRSTKAFASVTVNDKVTIFDIRVIGGTNGLYVAMPQSQDKDGNRYDVAFPVTADLRKTISKEILEQFKEKVADRKSSLGDKLQAGREKSAGHVAPQQAAAKTTTPGLGD